MAITITSLTHPTMIAKIRKGMYYAHKGQGHMMNGHGTRVYIENAKGHNVMRLDWVGGRQGYIVYGQESRDITATVKRALHRDVQRAMHNVISFERCFGKPAGSPRLIRIAALAALSAGLTGCQSSGVVTAVCSLVGGLIV
ncbi:hypothetical protein vB_PsyM_KIL4_0168 [Pseudomonas phage vB_PsyM_KIL4]|uniref:Uncharacterized protein n=2 Tax=Flaumdravirus TaxID=2560133 RepID=A0A142IF87_9CAUD|nr:hypothetical protein FDI83_gp045 [Pseudomonas phage vB_PsyM_KIL4]AMR57892.1 hypothetical protein vB_PsyM_KIL4_0168 [Pseudomonas phage vB_PsyM_KIL4]AMR58061.1 hypothetical protein vB_PsyM_KIL5_0170 [Pseudomonas phage vB_PsyM_KIL5]